MALTLLRHTTPLVADGICYGRMDMDVASSFASEVRAILPRLSRPAAIVSSPLKRCRILADAIAEKMGLPVQLEARIREMDFGAWEGRAWSDLPRHELDLWASDFLNARPHGGESVAMLRARVMDALHDYQAAGSDHLLVTHSGVIKAALARGDTVEHFSASPEFGAAIPLPENWPT